MRVEVNAETDGMIQSLLANNEGISSADEYIQMLVMEDHLTRRDLGASLNQKAAELEAMAIEGIESGESVEVDDAFWQRKRDHLHLDSR